MSSQCPLHTDAPSSQAAEIVKITGFDIFAPELRQPSIASWRLRIGSSIVSPCVASPNRGHLARTAFLRRVDNDFNVHIARF